MSISSRSDQDETRAPATVAQWVTAALFVVAVIALLMSQDWSRRLEAGIAEFFIGSILGVGSQLAPTGTELTVGAGTQMIFTLDVSFACSVVLLLIPLMALAAALLASGRASIFRTVPAVLVGAGALLALNACRFLMIAALTHATGLEGYGWAHTVYGSMLVLIGLAIVLMAFVKVVSGSRKERQSAS